MRSRRRELTEDSGSPGWLMTYADLMTLLLVFFVLLFSMSNVEKERFAEAVKSFQTAFQRAVSGAPNSIVPLEHNAPTTRDTDINDSPCSRPISQAAPMSMRKPKPNAGHEPCSWTGSD